MIGRREFHYPKDEQIAEKVVAEYLGWFSKIKNRIQIEIESSSVGTGYEDALREAVYRDLRLHPKAGDRVLPDVLIISGTK